MNIPGPFKNVKSKKYKGGWCLIYIYMDKERVLTEGGHTLKCKRRNFSVLFDVLSSCRYVTYFHSIVVIFESFSMIDNIVTSK